MNMILLILIACSISLFSYRGAADDAPAIEQEALYFQITTGLIEEINTFLPEATYNQLRVFARGPIHKFPEVLDFTNDKISIQLRVSPNITVVNGLQINTFDLFKDAELIREERQQQKVDFKILFEAIAHRIALQIQNRLPKNHTKTAFLNVAKYLTLFSSAGLILTQDFLNTLTTGTAFTTFWLLNQYLSLPIKTDEITNQLKLLIEVHEIVLINSNPTSVFQRHKKECLELLNPI